MTDNERIKILREMTGKEPRLKEKTRSSSTLTMQQMHGHLPGRKCRECKHCYYITTSKRYYKCKLWKFSLSKASDIKVFDTACGKFEAVEGTISNGVKA